MWDLLPVCGGRVESVDAEDVLEECSTKPVGGPYNGEDFVSEGVDLTT